MSKDHTSIMCSHKRLTAGGWQATGKLLRTGVRTKFCTESTQNIPSEMGMYMYFVFCSRKGTWLVMDTL